MADFARMRRDRTSWTGSNGSYRGFSRLPGIELPSVGFAILDALSSRQSP